MPSLPHVKGLPEVMGVVVASEDGAVEPPEAADSDSRGVAASSAAALRDLGEAGTLLGFAGLQTVLVKGRATAAVTAARADGFVVVRLDPQKPTGQAEKAVADWAAEAGVRRRGASRPAPRTNPGRPPVAPPRSLVEIADLPLPYRTAAPAAEPATSDPATTLETMPTFPEPDLDWPVVQEAAPPPSAPGSIDVAYAELRHAVIRALLPEAAFRSEQIAEVFAGLSGPPGCEELALEDHEVATRALLEGVQSVVAGDCVGALARLKDVADGSMPNLTFRWLALFWSVRAAIDSGYITGAISFANDAAAAAALLDDEARACTTWVRGLLLAQQGKPGQALAHVAEARKAFEHATDSWGVGQTWLAEARILAALDREPHATEAAEKARFAVPSWEDPVIFLARRAAIRGDLDGADRTLALTTSAGAERERWLLSQVRSGVVSPGDAAHFLRAVEAPANATSAREFERIGRSWPRFIEARAQLAWVLLKLGKYTEAGTIFRYLLEQELSPSTRASVTVGLGCIENRKDAGKKLEARLRATVGPPRSRPSTREGTPPPARRSQPPSSPPTPVPLRPDLPAQSVVDDRSASSSGRRMNVFSGELSEFALPDLLEFLRGGKRTGMLVCSSSAGVGGLGFRRGFVTGGASPATPHIGRLLVELKHLDEATLRSVIARQSTDYRDQLIGAVLVRERMVDAAAVRAALERQIEIAIREMVHWREGQFTFTAEGVSEPQSADVDVLVDPQATLLNIFKEIDEGLRRPTRPPVSDF